MSRCVWLVLLLVMATGVVHAADWQMDAKSSRLEFSATFEKTAAPGVFREFDARVHFDPNVIAEGRLDVAIAVKSADMSSSDVNKAIAGADWFDFARFPQAEFHAAEFRRTAANHYVARGMLNLKGVARAIEVPFTWTESGDTARMEGEFTVKRAAFGIGTGEWASTGVIGADVKVRFNVRLAKRG